MMAGAAMAMTLAGAGWVAGRMAGGSASGGLGGLVPALLRPDSANSGKSVSIASGAVDPDFEGLFLLDHKAGNLYCVLINPRNGAEVGLFQANVFAGLQLANVADTDLVMNTGFIRLSAGGRVNNASFANCICYVVDGVSGKAAGYTFQYNRQAVERGVRQAGQLVQIWSGVIRAGVQVPPIANPDAPAGDANPAAPANPGGANPPPAGGGGN